MMATGPDAPVCPWKADQAHSDALMDEEREANVPVSGNVRQADAMDMIDLQRKARPKEGRIECYWFENEHIGLARTLFHRIVLPFEPFDSGLDYVDQPESTELVIDWINLGLEDPARLDGIVVAMGETPDIEASIYLGGAHNWVEIEELKLTEHRGRYLVRCRATVEFENEGVAKNEPFEFQTSAAYHGEV